MSDVSIAKDVKNRQIEEFITRLEGLEIDKRGDLAVLKRNAGKTLSESKGVYRIFYNILPYGVAGSYEEIYYLIATLYGHNNHKKHLTKGDFGMTMRTVKDKMQSENIDHRMSILLDSSFDYIGQYPGGGELPYRLRQCIKLANSQDIGVNWTKLLSDLMLWNRPEKWVQKRWAKSYFGYMKSTENESNEQLKERMVE